MQPSTRSAAVKAMGLLLWAAMCSAAPLGDWQTGTAVPFGGPQDGKDPHLTSGGLLEGSCGEQGPCMPTEGCLARASAAAHACVRQRSFLPCAAHAPPF